jgi:hypothetical protein
MNRELIDMCAELSSKSKLFSLNPGNVWDKFDTSLRKLVSSSQWHEVKFVDESNGMPHSDMSTIPNNAGGIYVFVLKPDLIPNTHLYIMYIGRARHTNNQNLRKRCREYFSDTKRVKVAMMKEHWNNHLYIRYLPLTDNNIIDRLEEGLINAVLPPCNDKIPDRITMMAKKSAF